LLAREQLVPDLLDLGHGYGHLGCVEGWVEGGRLRDHRLDHVGRPQQLPELPDHCGLEFGHG
jgi:hypothetical protein